MPTEDEVQEPIILPNPEEKEKKEVKSIEVVIDPKEKPKEEPIKINFLDNKHIEDKVSEPTKKDAENKTNSTSSSSSSSSTTPPPKNINEFREQLIAEEKESEQELKLEDFQENSDFIMDLISMGLTALFRWYSMDTTDTPYEFPKPKVEKLKNQLTKILVRYNKAFPIVGVFIGTLLASCATPAIKAHEHRKLVKEEKAKQKKKDDELEAKKKAEGGGDDNNTGSETRNPLKRGRGQPRK